MQNADKTPESLDMETFDMNNQEPWWQALKRNDRKSNWLERTKPLIWC